MWERHIYVYKDFMPNIMVNEGKTTSNLKGQQVAYQGKQLKNKIQNYFK